MRARTLSRKDLFRFGIAAYGDRLFVSVFTILAAEDQTDDFVFIILGHIHDNRQPEDIKIVAGSQKELPGGIQLSFENVTGRSKLIDSSSTLKVPYDRDVL